MTTNLYQDLANAVTRYDRENQAWAAKGKRRYYNPHALDIYLTRAEECASIVQDGVSLADALPECFEHELLAHIIKYLAGIGYKDLTKD